MATLPFTMDKNVRVSGQSIFRAVISFFSSPPPPGMVFYLFLHLPPLPYCSSDPGSHTAGTPPSSSAPVRTFAFIARRVHSAFSSESAGYNIKTSPSGYKLAGYLQLVTCGIFLRSAFLCLRGTWPGGVSHWTCVFLSMKTQRRLGVQSRCGDKTLGNWSQIYCRFL